MRAGPGAVQRELERLAASGIVKVESVGNQKRGESRIADLQQASLDRGQDGGESRVRSSRRSRSALAPIEDSIELASLYGSIARGTDRASSDIDVLIVSDTLTLGAPFSALANAEA